MAVRLTPKPNILGFFPQNMSKNNEYLNEWPASSVSPSPYTLKLIFWCLLASSALYDYMRNFSICLSSCGRNKRHTFREILDHYGLFYTLKSNEKMKAMNDFAYAASSHVVGGRGRWWGRRGLLGRRWTISSSRWRGDRPSNNPCTTGAFVRIIIWVRDGRKRKSHY